MFSFRVKAAAMAVVLGMSLVPASSMAAGLGSASTSAGSPAEQEVNAAKAEMRAGRYEEAVPILQTARDKEPKNPDVHNLLAYAYRNLGQFDEAAASYNMALSIDPNHKQALEYQGEMFLRLGKLDLAKQNLEKLNDLCFFGCVEYTDLKDEIARYK